jgi:hypothetical protein
MMDNKISCLAFATESDFGFILLIIFCFILLESIPEGDNLSIIQDCSFYKHHQKDTLQ